MNPLEHFWQALSLLTRPDDPDHNDALIRDFARVSGLSEERVRLSLKQAMRLPNGARQ
jgi:hypothetical protein